MSTKFKTGDMVIMSPQSSFPGQSRGYSGRVIRILHDSFDYEVEWFYGGRYSYFEKDLLPSCSNYLNKDNILRIKEFARKV